MNYSKEHLEEIKNSEWAIDLKGYFNEKIAELNNLSTIKGNVEEKGVMVDARGEAVKILKDILYFLEDKKGKGRPKKNIYI